MICLTCGSNQIPEMRVKALRLLKVPIMEFDCLECNNKKSWLKNSKMSQEKKTNKNNPEVQDKPHKTKGRYKKFDKFLAFKMNGKDCGEFIH